MPSEKSHRVSVRKNARNRAERSAIRTIRIAAMAKTATTDDMKAAIAAADRAGRKRTIHPNKASRQKSQLMKAMNKVKK